MSQTVVTEVSLVHTVETEDTHIVVSEVAGVNVVTAGTQGPQGIPGSGGGSSVPLPGEVTRTGGLISEIALTGGATYTIGRDVNDRIETIDDGTYLRTFTRDGNGRIESWTVT